MFVVRKQYTVKLVFFNCIPLNNRFGFFPFDILVWWALKLQKYTHLIHILCSHNSPVSFDKRCLRGLWCWAVSLVSLIYVCVIDCCTCKQCVRYRCFSISVWIHYDCVCLSFTYLTLVCLWWRKYGTKANVRRNYIIRRFFYLTYRWDHPFGDWVFHFTQCLQCSSMSWHMTDWIAFSQESSKYASHHKVHSYTRWTLSYTSHGVLRGHLERAMWN